MTDKTYIVHITTQAEEQLRGIVTYISTGLNAPKAARRLLEEMERSILSLSRFPQRVALTEEEPWKQSGIHKMPVKNFLIYYWIDEQSSKVYVTAVICGRRDQLKQLSQMEME